MNDFKRGLHILLIIRKIKRPFKWFAQKCEQWEGDVISKYRLF